MTLLAFGINHKTAPVDIRERFSFAPEFMGDALKALCQLPQVKEGVILSTCNRSELYCEVENYDDALTNIKQWLATYHSIGLEQLNQYSITFQGNKVAEHLCEVACGLDSLVLGEPQILGQLKSAYAVARDHGSISQSLNRLFPHAFSVAKQVRTHTAIGENPVSIAFAAVSMSARIFDDLNQCTALLIGAGETIDLVAKHLKDKGIGKIIIANRTLTRAQELAKQFDAKAILLSDIPGNLIQADIVISSTASQLPILGKGAVEKALKARRHKPIFMVDIAVPRDIEEEVGNLSDVYLYTVDDLKGVIETNMQNRKEAAIEAQDLIQQGLAKYSQTQKSLKAVDTIKSFRNHVESIRDAELERSITLIQNGSDPKDVLEQFAHRLTNKFLHAPSLELKKASVEGNQDIHTALNRLFQISEK
ncbi:glutamyl-tRNA reductase [Marinicellulosiphila megalodicopiae]|uniref:glutamyl-tRNA reductase n=1 Tax=Marinicellulosiphila megalodicopiae TaxID=2724896 RepID=UPI003BAEF55D